MTSQSDVLHAGFFGQKSEVKRSSSMHENVPVWYDCCSCEAEPYWVEAFEQCKADNADDVQAGIEEA